MDQLYTDTKDFCIICRHFMHKKFNECNNSDMFLYALLMFSYSQRMIKIDLKVSEL